MEFRLALCQMLVEGGAMDRNLARAERMIAEVAAANADIVLLPETMDLGWTHPSAAREAEGVPDGAPFRRIAAAAARHAVFVCAGLTERDGDRVYNCAVLIDRGGALLLRHRKLNELDIAHDLYAQGDRLNVAHTELGTIGVMICADGFAKDRVLSRALGYMGADFILSPSAWAVPPDHDNAAQPYGKTWLDAYCPAAAEFGMWIAGVSNVGPITAGPWRGMNCIGGSLVVAPDGATALQGPYGVDAEELLLTTVKPLPRPARGCGWVKHWEARG
jgi:predicted amidohydrolase